MASKIPQDKQKHVVAGALIAIISMVALHLIWPARQWFNAALVIGVTTVVGFGFELFSYVTGLGHADWIDGVATVIGGIIGIILAMSIYGMIHLF